MASAFVVDRESTTLLEAMAAGRCAHSFAHSCAGKRVLMEGDNEALTQALSKCYSRLPGVIRCIHTVWHGLSSERICMRSSHIIGTYTSVALAHLHVPSGAVWQFLMTTFVLCVQARSLTKLLTTSPTIASATRLHALSQPSA